jgi:diguanylate cyclase (GGDEF)-like protein
VLATIIWGRPPGVERGPLVPHHRDDAADQRDNAADQRDDVADQRDQAAELRDGAADKRDDAADQRDAAAEQRDDAGEQRDQAAEKAEASLSVGAGSDATGRSASARRDAASDRRQASDDRREGASERSQAELDRDTALADRGAGARGRRQAGVDRQTSVGDRASAARERRSASIDGLTGVYVRDAGLVELEREIVRARRTDQSLVVAFVDVDGLKLINDSHGHGAGDRMLLEVTKTLAAILRSYDLIIRHGGDEFVCALPGLSIADATERLALVNAALAEAPTHGSVTVGLAELQPQDSLSDLIARADAALYRQRRQRRRR